MIHTRESCMQWGFLDVVIFYCQLVECGQTKKLCPSTFENGKEKALIFLGVSVLCAFQVSVILMRNNIHLLIKKNSKASREILLSTPSFLVLCFRNSFTAQAKLFVLGVLNWSGVLINSHSKALACAAWGKQHMDTSFIGMLSLVGPHLWEAWLYWLRSLG